VIETQIKTPLLRQYVIEVENDFNELKIIGNKLDQILEIVKKEYPILLELEKVRFEYSNKFYDYQEKFDKLEKLFIETEKEGA
jgi:hypothetical protein